MLYIIYQEDRDDGAEIRAANKDEHFAYLERHQDILLLGGALLGDEGSSAPEAVSSSTWRGARRRRTYRKHRIRTVRNANGIRHYHRVVPGIRELNVRERK